MAQITITIDIDDRIGDISMTIEEIHANGVEIKRDFTDEPPT